MIKTILWDFDGVILDSMKIKGNGFLELFKDYDIEELSKLEKYHYENGGVSRFDKIKFFFDEIVCIKTSNLEIGKLANEFAEIIHKKLFDKENLILDSLEFIEKNYQKYNFHIVSGAEHNELNSICNYLDISKYFITIQGSPTKKDILIENILKKYNYEILETILIGDSLNDYVAASKNAIKFYGYNNLKLKRFDYIDSFEGFNK